MYSLQLTPFPNSHQIVVRKSSVFFFILCFFFGYSVGQVWWNERKKAQFNSKLNYAPYTKFVILFHRSMWIYNTEFIISHMSAFIKSTKIQAFLPQNLISVDPFCCQTADPLPAEPRLDELATTCCSIRCWVSFACYQNDEMSSGPIRPILLNLFKVLFRWSVAKQQNQQKIKYILAHEIRNKTAERQKNHKRKCSIQYECFCFCRFAAWDGKKAILYIFTKKNMIFLE